MRKVIQRTYLNKMPFDKWADGKYTHATGCEVLYEGWEYSTIEYEDDLEWSYDASDCEYFYED